MRFHVFAIAVVAALCATSGNAVTPSLCLGSCDSEKGYKECTFNVKLDLSASELGYYSFDGCAGTNPTLGIERDVTYKFVQEHLSNYYHPLGFAYFADGAHDGVDELEPSIKPAGSDSTCESSNSCPAPMYMLNGEYLGTYSNNADIVAKIGDEDFGLDVYEPQFFASPPDWAAAGTYEVALKFDVNDFKNDIFYFCHIHQFMTGRIKFIDSSGLVINTEDNPEIPYPYESPSEYDKSCGTHGIGDFTLPHAECPKEFVCNKPEGKVGQFAGCIESMNCAMAVGMTTNVNSNEALALFTHQMIPHHQNAVNMCKALMATGELDSCEDINEETARCTIKVICYEIINHQNHQIQSLRGALEELDYVSEDDCVVLMDYQPVSPKSPKKNDKSSKKSPKTKKGKKGRR